MQSAKSPCQNGCRPLESTTWSWSSIDLKLTAQPIVNLQIPEFCGQEIPAQNGITIIFVKTAPWTDGPQLRDCSKCRHALSLAFDMPEFWWKAHYKRANGFFGFQELPSVGKRQTGAISWCRIKIKLLASGDQQRMEYVWAKLNVFLRYYETPRHTVAIIFDPEKICIESGNAQDTFYETLTSGLDQIELDNPFWVYPRLLDILIRVQDKSVWAIRDLVRGTELRRERRHASDTSFLEGIDFPKLYSCQRHAIHVSETLEVAIHAIGQIQKHHERYHIGKESSSSAIITHGLLYQESFINGLLHMSDANKTRLSNEIRLAFDMVTQFDSRLTLEIAKAAKQDSSAMTTIAAVSLLFLPATFTAAIFSTSFFNFDGNSGAWRVSGKFWVYWAVAIPLTIGAVLTWYGKSMWRRVIEFKQVRQ